MQTKPLITAGALTFVGGRAVAVVTLRMELPMVVPLLEGCQLEEGLDLHELEATAKAALDELYPPEQPSEPPPSDKA
jgi:hypothetical protein